MGKRDLPKGYEYRDFTGCEVRVASENDDMVTIEGHAATFNDAYPIADFEEVIAPGAFGDSIKGDDIRLLVNHEGLPLARTTSGTLDLSEDKSGLAVRSDLDPDDPDVRRLLPKMARGDVDQMSFGFAAEKDTWEEREGEPDLRTIERARLWDVSIVTFPANPNTDVAVRRHAEWRSAAVVTEPAEDVTEDATAETDTDDVTEDATAETDTDDVAIAAAERARRLKLLEADLKL